MALKYARALISSTSAREAKKIVAALTKQKLIAGALVTSGQAMYWWKGKLVSRKYWNISTFTKVSLEKKIIACVRPLHADKVPIITFYKISAANPDFLAWVKQYTI